MTRILVVDDDAALRRMLKLMLTRDGHDVVVASDGREALQVASETPFDLVITDLIMPEVEGIHLIRELKRLVRRPRVIAMSGGGRGAKEDYLQMATFLGASATLEKPFTQQELSAVVARAMQTTDAGPALT
jgi:CheY-like chemotaxis protein